MTALEIAQRVHTEVNEMRTLKGLAPMGITHLSICEQYVTDGLALLKALGYDPDDADLEAARPIADEAALEYAKAKISGLSPDQSAPWRLQKKRWRNKAAWTIKKAEYDAFHADDEV